MDVRTSPSHCGTCGVVCGFRSTCADGRCRATCPGEGCDCAGLGAAQFAVNDDHCGACNVRCSLDQACVEGRCVDAWPRLVAPLSTARVTSARPWLRWALRSGAEGARVELCDAPTCARVSRQWEVPGEVLRVPESLRPGVYFWRVTGRREGRSVSLPGPVWEFFVPERPGAAGSPVGPVTDFNRDGLEDRFELDEPGPPAHFYTRRLRAYLGTPAGPSPSPSWTKIIEGYEYNPYPWLRVSYGPAFDPSYVGDMNGDGYGDLAMSYRTPEWPGVCRNVQNFLYVGSASGLGGLGGPDGFAAPLGPGVDCGEQTQWTAPAADHDGDGFGDLTSRWSGQMSWGGAVLRYGPPHNGLACPSSERPVPRVRGDFNADGADDLVYGRCGSAPPDLGAFEVVPMFVGSRTRDRPTYPIHSCDPRPPADAQWERDVRVADDDGDGYDDLLVWTGATPTARVVFPGGPEGLVDGRCTRFP